MPPPFLFDLNESPPQSSSNLHHNEGEYENSSGATGNLVGEEEEESTVSGADTQEGHQAHVFGKQLAYIEKLEIIQKLLERTVNGRLKHGIINQIAAEFNISRQCCSRLWKKAKTDLQMGGLINYHSNKKGRVGRKCKEIDLSALHQIPLRQRTNIRSITHALDYPKSTVHRLVKKGMIRPHSNALKPALTAENKLKRLDFCLSQVITNDQTHVFRSCFDLVHIDEKWFFISKVGQKYYLHPMEDDSIRTCKSKRFITKVMFMAAIGRPQYSDEGECLFDGKIGIWPFVNIEPAKRNSKNRPAGELVTKPIVSITKDTIRESLISKVIPAIKQKWLATTSKTIYIQQDNARPHINSTDPEFLMAAKSDSFDISLVCQPPNSPDLNCLDLGYFNAIQSLQHEKAPKDVNELVEAVLESFLEMEPKKLNYVWLSFQATMTEIMKNLGGNNFKLPHMGKGRLERLGELPLNLTVDNDVLETANHHLEDQRSNNAQVTEDAT